MNKQNGSALQNRSTGGMTGCRVLVSALAVCLLLSDMAASGKFGASAMHIMEGYLPAGWCIAWGALCIPFLVAGAVSLKRKIAYQGRVKLLTTESAEAHQWQAAQGDIGGVSADLPPGSKD